MCETKNYIKIFDEGIATALKGGGFSCIEQRINDGQNIYAFEETPDFMEALEKIFSTENYQGAIYVRDNSLSF